MKYITNKIVLGFFIAMSAAQSLQTVNKFPSKREVMLACTDLGINLQEQTLTAALAQKNYRTLAMKWHPDRHSQSTNAEKKAAENKFKDINNANGVLNRYDFKSYNFSNTRNAHDDLNDWMSQFLAKQAQENRKARAPSAVPAQQRTEPQEPVSVQQSFGERAYEAAHDVYNAFLEDVKTVWKPCLASASCIIALVVFEQFYRYKTLQRMATQSLTYEQFQRTTVPLWLLVGSAFGSYLYYFPWEDAHLSNENAFFRRLGPIFVTNFCVSGLFGCVCVQKIWAIN